MHLTGPKFGASRLTRIVSKVEVERKFNLGSKFASVFLSDDLSHSPTRYHKVYNTQDRLSFTFVKQPGQIIRDIYYDTPNERLSTLGLWVRQRHVQYFPLDACGQTSDHNHETTTKVGVVGTKEDVLEQHWNAKLRVGGHFNNSEFVEIDGKKNVSDEVLRITGSQTKLEDLQIVTDLETKRLSWEVARLADGTKPAADMTIVMDVVTEANAMVNNHGGAESAFTHTIGEVELFQEFVTEGADKTTHEVQRKTIAALRMQELKGFMMANANLFATTPKPIGKLTAYEMWKSSRD